MIGSFAMVLIGGSGGSWGDYSICFMAVHFWCLTTLSATKTRYPAISAFF
jgi:hypothetical protein